MAYLARSPSRLLSPDRSFLMHWILKRTLYAQFCAGENRMETRTTIGRLKGMGYSGVILAYARELELDHDTASELVGEHKENEKSLEDAQLWKEGTLETVRLASAGDFVAVKKGSNTQPRFTGAGPTAVYRLSHNLPPTPGLETAIADICDLAVTRNVRLLVDAEQQAVQSGIDSWTLEFMRRYNRRNPGKAVVYGTYQSYLKSTPQTLTTHLATAYGEGFTLGVKLVRGAYLASDPRHLINDTKEQTDEAFDSLAESLIRRSYSGGILQPAINRTATPFPSVNLVLATHNHTSIRKAQALITSAREEGPSTTDGGSTPDVAYAQLMGMADEVSCELLLQAAYSSSSSSSSSPSRGDDPATTNNPPPRAYKYLAWGSVGECMKYLLRRAEENRDALARTTHARNALAKELWRRLERLGQSGARG
ncbi:hypothetical protein GP486_008521 [Trichoglossum hirsutum]|uniref:Proline dehydrogenase n=1 Tax=Trichoglossum hirsutum TaxID=265104 RepID=A0A9P8L671_9PEZI|nr:hypothetical protein GP486_008521 [Trichoglossum hirsutum]